MKPKMENFFADWTKIVNFSEKVLEKYGIKGEKFNLTF
jgi:hypothetical protein